MQAAMIWVVAYLWDRLVGDPRWLPHPVIMMGRGIVWVEKVVRKLARTEASLKPLGILLPFIIVGGSWAITWLLLAMLYKIHPWLAWSIEALLIGTTIAVKGLQEAGLAVYRQLEAGNIVKARTEVGMIVGRDTTELDEPEVVRAAVETVAENIVDAVIAPLCFALLGGAPLAIAYRAVNTLDSMVGYRNEKYRNLGWASARLDDAANWIPARITALLIVCCAFLLPGLDGRQAWRMAMRDAKKHPSPNSGWAEASAAGAMHVQLGGFNVYHGVRSFRAQMGEPREVLAARHIPAVCRLLRGTSLMFAAVGFAVLWFRGGWLL